MALCETCGRKAYPAESIAVDGRTFHKLCWKCTECGTALKLGSYGVYDGQFYCSAHARQLRKETAGTGSRSSKYSSYPPQPGKSVISGSPTPSRPISGVSQGESPSIVAFPLDAPPQQPMTTEEKLLGAMVKPSSMAAAYLPTTSLDRLPTPSQVSDMFDITSQMSEIDPRAGYSASTVSVTGSEFGPPVFRAPPATVVQLPTSEAPPASFPTSVSPPFPPPPSDPSPKFSIQPATPGSERDEPLLSAAGIPVIVPANQESGSYNQEESRPAQVSSTGASSNAAAWGETMTSTGPSPPPKSPPAERASAEGAGETGIPTGEFAQEGAARSESPAAPSPTPEMTQIKGKEKATSPTSSAVSSNPRAAKRSEQTQAEIERMRSKLLAMGILSPGDAAKNNSSSSGDRTNSTPIELGSLDKEKGEKPATAGAFAGPAAPASRMPSAPQSARGSPKPLELSTNGKIFTAAELAAMGIQSEDERSKVSTAEITPAAENQPTESQSQSVPAKPPTATSAAGGYTSALGMYEYINDDDRMTSRGGGGAGTLGGSGSVYGAYGYQPSEAGGRPVESVIGGYAATTNRSEFDAGRYYAGTHGGMRSPEGMSQSWAGYDPSVVGAAPPFAASQRYDSGSRLGGRNEWGGDAVNAMALAGIGSTEAGTPIPGYLPSFTPPNDLPTDMDDILSGYDAATQTYDLNRVVSFDDGESYESSDESGSEYTDDEDESEYTDETVDAVPILPPPIVPPVGPPGGPPLGLAPLPMEQPPQPEIDREKEAELAHRRFLRKLAMIVLGTLGVLGILGLIGAIVAGTQLNPTYPLQGLNSTTTTTLLSTSMSRSTFATTSSRFTTTRTSRTTSTKLQTTETLTPSEPTTIESSSTELTTVGLSCRDFAPSDLILSTLTQETTPSPTTTTTTTTTTTKTTTTTTTVRSHGTRVEGEKLTLGVFFQTTTTTTSKTTTTTQGNPLTEIASKITVRQASATFNARMSLKSQSRLVDSPSHPEKVRPKPSGGDPTVAGRDSAGGSIVDGTPNKSWTFSRWRRHLWVRLGGTMQPDLSQWNLTTSTNFRNREAVLDPSRRSQDVVMGIKYPKGTWDLATGGGSAFVARPMDLIESPGVIFEYEVFFPADFSFYGGGRLPGLFGGTGRCSEDDLDSEECFSTRYMVCLIACFSCLRGC